MVRFLLLLFLAPAAAQAVDSRVIDRPLDRLQHKIEDARNAGKISNAQFDRLNATLDNIKLMREEALSDGNLTATERDTLLKAIREGEVQLAEAKTAPQSPDIAAEESTDDTSTDTPVAPSTWTTRPPRHAGSAQ
jgi:hypothetical protein